MRPSAHYVLLAVGMTVLSLGCRAKGGDGSGVSMLEDSLHAATRADSTMAAGERLAIPEEPPPFAASDPGGDAAMLDDRRDRSRDTIASPSSRATPIPEEPRPGRP